ncbi:MAG: hypothetical protein U5R06_10345 [candidate division KSB1 bacterium]|nr:hypothetical protein [candidate division KSB1 bacterium]
MRYGVWTIIIFLCVLVMKINGETLPVSVLHHQGSVLSVNDGNDVTARFQLLNKSSAVQTLKSKVLLPLNWRLVIEPVGFDLQPHQKCIDLISFYIPKNTKAAQYPVQYLLIDAKNPDKTRSFTLWIQVKENHHLILNPVSIPDYVRAGTRIEAVYNICNAGNLQDTVIIDVDGAQIINQFDPVILSPDSCYLFQLSARTDKNITSAGKKRIHLRAQVKNMDSTWVSSTHLVDVLPVKTGKVDSYFDFPLRTKLAYFYSDYTARQKSGPQFQVQGSGYVDKNKNHHLMLNMRGPDYYGYSSLGQYDLYALSYQFKKLRVDVGDHAKRVTQLTENHRFGRGVSVSLNLDHLQVGGFFQQPRWRPEFEKEYAVHSRVHLNSREYLGINVLQKEYSNYSAQLISYVGQVSPFKFLRTRIEMSTSTAQDKSGTGADISVHTELGKLRANASILYADKNYQGYYNDSEYISANASYHLTNNWLFTLNLQKDADNLDQDTTLYVAPYSERLQFGVQHRLTGNVYLFGAYRQIMRKDRLPRHLFSYEEQTIHLRSSLKQNNWRLSVYSDFGYFQNLLPGFEKINSLLFKLNSNVSYQPSINQFYRLFFYYENSKQYSMQRNSTLNIGFHARIHIRPDWKIQVSMQNGFKLEEYYRDRDLFQADIEYTLPFKHSIEFQARYSLLRYRTHLKDKAFIINYRAPFGIPLYKKEDLAQIRGKISSQNGENINNIIVRLNGYTAITDTAGYFVFSGIKPGLHFISLDRSTLGMQHVTTIPLPIKIQALPEGDNYFGLTLTTGAIVSGRLHVLQDGKKNPLSTLDTPCSQIVIEMRQGEQVLRRIANKDGSFEFENTRPGNWQLKVYDNCIPDTHQLERSEWAFQLNPGGQKHIEIMLQRKERKIQFQQWDDVVD